MADWLGSQVIQWFCTVLRPLPLPGLHSMDWKPRWRHSRRCQNGYCHRILLPRLLSTDPGSPPLPPVGTGSPAFTSVDDGNELLSPPFPLQWNMGHLQNLCHLKWSPGSPAFPPMDPGSLRLVELKCKVLWSHKLAPNTSGTRVEIGPSPTTARPPQRCPPRPSLQADNTDGRSLSH